MKYLRQQSIIILAILLVGAVNLFLAVDAKQQRKNSTSQRAEILCVLKILPADRQAHPEKVEACK